MKESRNLNISFTLSGSKSESTRLSLPITWIRSMGLSRSDKEIIATFDEEEGKIIIEKKK